LKVVRLETFGPKGVLLSDARFSNWQGVIGDQEHASGTAPIGPSEFPNSISITRPHDDYKLDLQVLKITLNGDLPADRFKLEQPAGSELVQVGEASEKRP
jgi:hypothetical protein